MPDDERERVQAVARALIASAADDPAARAGEPGPALPVTAPGGELDSWFVPLVDGDRLAGFLQLEPEPRLTLRRRSAFPQPQPAASWLDPDSVRARARAEAGAGAPLGAPRLTYDAHPGRVAWAVPLEDGSGRAVYVAGDHAWIGDSA